jgi:DNA-binding beta-propeller fold protein YncE
MFAPVGRAPVWPAPPETARIRFVGTYASSDVLKAGKSGGEVVKDVLRGPRPSVKLTAPQAVAIGPGGLLAVADGAGAAVHIINITNRSHTLVGGWAEERFAVPFGVTWAGERLFVTDAQRKEVIELTFDGTFRNRFGGGELSRPVGIAFVAQREQLYVVDGGAHCVRTFDLDGRPISQFGGRGSDPGWFNFPSHVTAAGDRLILADGGNFRVQLLDLDGGSRGVIGKKGDAAGDFALPKGVAVDADGNIHVVDSQFENVQIFNDGGQLLLAFGEEGTAIGKFSLPAGLAIGDDDRIWVADAGNHRLQIFQYLRAAS